MIKVLSPPDDQRTPIPSTTGVNQVGSKWRMRKRRDGKTKRKDEWDLVGPMLLVWHDRWGRIGPLDSPLVTLS